MPKLPEIKPAPIVPNQEKQIKLMTDMVNKQSEMINQQNELIALIREEAISSSKQSRLAMCLTLISLMDKRITVTARNDIEIELFLIDFSLAITVNCNFVISFSSS